MAETFRLYRISVVGWGGHYLVQTQACLLAQFCFAWAVIIEAQTYWVFLNTIFKMLLFYLLSQCIHVKQLTATDVLIFTAEKRCFQFFRFSPWPTLYNL